MCIVSSILSENLIEIFQIYDVKISICSIFVDPPTFIETPKSIEADKGEKISLMCSADGNPVEIVWVHDPIDRVSFFFF